MIHKSHNLYTQFLKSTTLFSRLRCFKACVDAVFKFRAHFKIAVKKRSFAPSIIIKTYLITYVATNSWNRCL